MNNIAWNISMHLQRNIMQLCTQVLCWWSVCVHLMHTPAIACRADEFLFLFHGHCHCFYGQILFKPGINLVGWTNLYG